MQIKTETKVGAFVLVALAVLVYMAIFLGAFKWHLRSYAKYVVSFQNVAGLVKKADVKIAGVKVGWVDKIRLSSKSDLAEVVLMIGDSYQLYADAKIEISQEGLLGSKFINIMPGTNHDKLLLPVNDLMIKGHTPASIEDLITKFDQVAQNIDVFLTKVSPASDGINSAMQKLDQIIEKDFHKMVNGLDQTLDAVQSVVKKVDDGTGAFSKLLNEPELYDNLRQTSHNLRQITQIYGDMGLLVDSHFEAMFRNCSNNYCHKQFKGYLDVWGVFRQDYFGLFELVWSECGGVVKRDEFYTSYFNQNYQPITSTQISQLDSHYALVPPITQETIVKRDQFLYGLQAGKWFNNWAVRAGLIESYLGFALDYDFPFSNPDWQWITTLEFFDFKGQGRLCDRRPHFKWLNEVFFRKNLYLAFGIDDFISQNDLNPFIGVGITFGNY